MRFNTYNNKHLYVICYFRLSHSVNIDATHLKSGLWFECSLLRRPLKKNWHVF